MHLKGQTKAGFVELERRRTIKLQGQLQAESYI